ncbi:MAG: (d)CMP kinase, partial [Propionibacteriaceae bacterium]|nr:(d)CMP kinase [Propionibacteriaceae bacterium]
MQSLVIAVDGPSGSGKSSTSRLVAKRLGLAYLDTGAMYRAIALGCEAAGLLADRGGIAAFTRGAQLDVGTDPGAPTILLNGVNVTAAIRAPQVSACVSTVAVVPQVRSILTGQMRQIVSKAHRIVLEGRDTTTVVTPNADVRVLLVANQDARMARRQAELDGVSQADLTDQVVRRDRDDATVSQFETPAPGVTCIDSTDMTLDEVADAIIALVPPTRRGSHCAGGGASR